MKNRPLLEKQAKKQENKKTSKKQAKKQENRKTGSVGTLLFLLFVLWWELWPYTPFWKNSGYNYNQSIFCTSV